MVVMQAVMVQLPFAGSLGYDSMLQRLVESDVGVNTFGSETVKAVIAFKWKKFAMRQIYTKTFIYMSFLSAFTIFAVIYR